MLFSYMCPSGELENKTKQNHNVYNPPNPKHTQNEGLVYFQEILPFCELKPSLENRFQPITVFLKEQFNLLLSMQSGQGRVQHNFLHENIFLLSFKTWASLCSGTLEGQRALI